MDTVVMPFTIHREPQPLRQIVMGGAKPPVVETKPQGRIKKMADEKKLGKETGVKKISQEPANKQGPIGTNPQAPASPSEEVKIGNKEGEKNG